MSRPLLPGNQVDLLDWFRGERLEFYPKMQAFHAIGYALVTATNQVQIDVLVPSHVRDVSDLPLIVPTGATVYYIGFRTPASVALLGTSGERLKIGTAHTDVNPNIAFAAGNNIAANSSARIAATPYDTPAAPLGVLGAATQYRLFCSNAGNTAAGTGVRVATGTQRVIVDVCYLLAGDPSRIEQLGYQSTY